MKGEGIILGMAMGVALVSLAALMYSALHDEQDYNPRYQQCVVMDKGVWRCVEADDPAYFTQQRTGS